MAYFILAGLLSVCSFFISFISSISLSLFESIFGLIFFNFLKIKLNPLSPFITICCRMINDHFLPANPAAPCTSHFSILAILLETIGLIILYPYKYLQRRLISWMKNQ